MVILSSVVDRLCLNETAPAPTGPQAVRRWDDDQTEDENEDNPPRVRQRTRDEIAAIVDRLAPLAETTAKARFKDLPGPNQYPAYIAQEAVSADILPSEVELAWAAWCATTDARADAGKKLEAAEKKLANAVIALGRVASTQNQNKRDRLLPAYTAAVAREEEARRAETAAHDAILNLPNGDNDDYQTYQKHPYELLAKRVRALRIRNDNYRVLPEQLPPLSDPRNLGVAVYKIFEGNEERMKWVESMKHAVDNTPEFAEKYWGDDSQRAGQLRSLFDMTQTKIAAGGFAALNHPSSFHNQFVRSLRMRAHGEVVFRDLFGMMAEGANSGSTHLEQVVDRMMLRRSSQEPTAEAWHRDVAVGTRPGDRVFGGWINLNAYNQQFSCVLGSAHEARDPNNSVGFATIPESDHPETVARSSIVVIPPGHMIVFNEDTIHEVANNSNTESLLRLFTGWRLSQWAPDGQTPKPLIVDLDRRLNEQEGMPLKSGQHIHYYSKDYWNSKMPDARKHNATTNPMGFKNYPGPPPFYPSAYWGQVDPKTVSNFCEVLKPELVHRRFFKPGSATTRSFQFPNGVRCNLDIYHAPSGATFNANDAQPHNADTLRGLKEIKDWMETNYPNKVVAQWMQEDYAPEEVEILKPRGMRLLRLMLASPSCMARALPSNRATTVSGLTPAEPLARLMNTPNPN
jgi:hypothetical protein